MLKPRTKLVTQTQKKVRPAGNPPAVRRDVCMASPFVSPTGLLDIVERHEIDGVGLPHAHRNVSDPEFGAQKGEPPVLVTGVKGLELPREDPSPHSKLWGLFVIHPTFPLRKTSESRGASPGFRVWSKLSFHFKLNCEFVKLASKLKCVK